MTHEELCERARRWLSGTRRCDPVFSNIASCREIPDAIGWSSSWKARGSTVIECKTSRADFVADHQKYVIWKHPEDNRSLSYFDYRCWAGRPTGKRAEQLGYVKVDLRRMGDFRFFMCDPEVITPEMLNTHAPDHGLLYVEGRRIRIVRSAPRRVAEMIDKDGEIRYLRFAIINRKTSFSMPTVEAPPQNTSAEV